MLSLLDTLYLKGNEYLNLNENVWIVVKMVKPLFFHFRRMVPHTRKSMLKRQRKVRLLVEFKKTDALKCHLHVNVKVTHSHVLLFQSSKSRGWKGREWCRWGSWWTSRETSRWGRGVYLQVFCNLKVLLHITLEIIQCNSLCLFQEKVETKKQKTEEKEESTEAEVKA